MADPWLTIIGVGEDGPAGLSDASRKAMADAEIIFGGPRHLDLLDAGSKGRPWPVPFTVGPVLAEAGRKTVVLASGDPFWFGAGGSLAAHLPAGSYTVLGAPSVFSLSAAKLGWRLEDTVCLGLHAAPFARLYPLLAPGQKILCTLRDGIWLNDNVINHYFELISSDLLKLVDTSKWPGTAQYKSNKVLIWKTQFWQTLTNNASNNADELAKY